MLGEAMSIFALRHHSPSPYLPSRISRKICRLRSGVVSREGEGRPGRSGTPRYSFHSSCVRLQQYACPALIRLSAISYILSNMFEAL